MVYSLYKLSLHFNLIIKRSGNIQATTQFKATFKDAYSGSLSLTVDERMRKSIIYLSISSIYNKVARLIVSLSVRVTIPSSDPLSNIKSENLLGDKFTKDRP